MQQFPLASSVILLICAPLVTETRKYKNSQSAIGHDLALLSSASLPEGYELAGSNGMCTDTNNTAWNGGIEIGNHPRSHQNTVALCAARCDETDGCRGIVYWADGHCRTYYACDALLYEGTSEYNSSQAFKQVACSSYNATNCPSTRCTPSGTLCETTVTTTPQPPSGFVYAATHAMCTDTNMTPWDGGIEVGEHPRSNQSSLQACAQRCDGTSGCNGIVYWDNGQCRTYRACDAFLSEGYHEYMNSTAFRRSSQQPVSAYGDPHLANARGEKFDIHDGIHQLVHYPQGASANQVLLQLDVNAAILGQSCASVFIKSATLSGKWLGDNITFETTDLQDNVPIAAHIAGRPSTQVDWSSLDVGVHSDLKLPGAKQVQISKSLRDQSSKLPGGSGVIVSIGSQPPVLLEVWASRGANEYTGMKDVRFLNMQVRNLPAMSGGLLGLDHYVRPTESQCGLIESEQHLLEYVEGTTGLLSLTELPRWTISAQTSSNAGM